MTGIGLLAAGGVAGASAGFEAEPAIATEGPTARTAMPTGTAAHAATVTFRTAPAGRYMALTIDDGPTPRWTPQVHRLLAQHGAKATFFVVGERAFFIVIRCCRGNPCCSRRRPDSARRCRY